MKFCVLLVVLILPCLTLSQYEPSPEDNEILEDSTQSETVEAYSSTQPTTVASRRTSVSKTKRHRKTTTRRPTRLSRTFRNTQTSIQTTILAKSFSTTAVPYTSEAPLTSEVPYTSEAPFSDETASSTLVHLFTTDQILSERENSTFSPDFNSTASENSTFTPDFNITTESKDTTSLPSTPSKGLTDVTVRGWWFARWLGLNVSPSIPITSLPIVNNTSQPTVLPFEIINNNASN